MAELTEHEVALQVLTLIENELKDYVRQHQGILQVRKVINLYQDLLKEIPKIEKQIADLERERGKLETTYQNELSVHKKRMADAQAENVKATQGLSHETAVARDKTREVQAMVDNAERAGTKRIAELEQSIEDRVKALAQAREEYAAFRQRHLV